MLSVKHKYSIVTYMYTGRQLRKTDNVKLLRITVCIPVILCKSSLK